MNIYPSQIKKTLKLETKNKIIILKNFIAASLWNVMTLVYNAPPNNTNDDYDDAGLNCVKL